MCKHCTLLYKGLSIHRFWCAWGGDVSDERGLIYASDLKMSILWVISNRDVIRRVLKPGGDEDARCHIISGDDGSLWEL